MLTFLYELYLLLFSCPEISRLLMSGVFTPWDFDSPSFSRPAFSFNPTKYHWHILLFTLHFIACDVTLRLHVELSGFVQRQCTGKASTSPWTLATQPTELTLQLTRTASSTCSSVEC